MSIAFCTHCSDDWFYNGGCNKLIATAKYFHPDIPFYVFNNIELNKLSSKYSNKLRWEILNPIVSFEVSKIHEKVIHFDADSLILGKLDDIINFKEDIVGVRNNNDLDRASKSSHQPITINNCHPSEYMNAGLVGSNKKEFWEFWISENSKYAQNFVFFEQDVYNLIIQSKKFSFKCLDPKDSKFYFGVAGCMGSSTDWDNYKNMKKINGDYVVNNKIVKVFHQAGGSGYFPKLILNNFFSDEVVSDLTNIIDRGGVKYEKIIL